MKKNRLLAAIIIVLILIIVILIILINYFNKEKEYSTTPEDVEMDKYLYDATNKIEEEKNVATYLTVNNCVDMYLDYINKNNAEGILSILTNDYKKFKNINLENVIDNSIKVSYDYKYNADIVYSYDNDLYFNTYIVLGKIINLNNNTLENFNFIVYIDQKQRTFEIAPIDEEYQNYINYKENNIEQINKEKIQNNEKQIEVNNYNEANLAIGIGEKEVMKFYHDQIILKMINDTENAYEMLDSEYKQKRFVNYEEFKEFINENKESLEKSVILKYKIKKFDDYTEYLCKDSFDNYYIFKEIEPLNYSVLLDEYTIDDKIIFDDYKKENDSIKAQINLEKFEHMLNRKDYKSAYNVLNEDFRNKYYPMLEDFKNYIKDNFNENNSFNVVEIINNNNYYKIKTEIIGQNSTSNDIITKRFNIELLENNNFSIYFDV